MAIALRPWKFPFPRLSPATCRPAGVFGVGVGDEDVLGVGGEDVLLEGDAAGIELEEEFAVAGFAGVVVVKGVVGDEALFGMAAFFVVAADEDAADVVFVNEVITQADAGGGAAGVFAGKLDADIVVVVEELGSGR
jgi:hypothetical protein